MRVRTRIAALAAALLIGCSVIGESRVAGWPRLEIVEHHVPHREMRDRCARYVAAAMSPEACAEYDFAGGRCHIWYSADFPPPRYVVFHERRHCLGYEHAGESEMSRLLARYRAQAPVGSASAGSSR